MFRAIIIEDQYSTREFLKEIIKNELKEEIIVIGETDSVEEARELIDKVKPTLLLLDIKLTDGTGLDLINLINAPQIPVIFITAYKEYAVEAINSSQIIVDYILKPIGIDNLTKAISRIKEKKKTINESKTNNRNLIVKTKGESLVINKKQIIYIKALSRYSIIHTSKNEEIKIAKTLKEMNTLLNDDSSFFRMNKSYIVNTTHILAIERNKNLKLSLNNSIPITPIAKKRLMLLLRK